MVTLHEIDATDTWNNIAPNLSMFWEVIND